MSVFFRLSAQEPEEPISGSSVETPQLPPPPNKMLLTFSGVAKLFIKLRRHRTPESSEDNSSGDDSSPFPSSAVPSAPQTHNSSTITPPPTPKERAVVNRWPTSPTSPSSPHRPSSAPSSPSSPRSPTKQKTQRTETTSGTEPLSHPGLAETACERREPVERTDTYICTGGVNVLILLRTTRAELMDTVSPLGANALVGEQWRCTIYGPKNKATYKVRIHYKAYGTRSAIPDPHQPVAVDHTHNIPGLMTILRRNDD